MGIVIDNSGSMREKRDKVNQAALNLVRSSNPQDQVFVVNFNDEYYLDQEFTSDINKLREALEKVEARGGTALYDAVVASAVYMKDRAKLQKKVLFVVTDGEDNASRESLEEAVRRLQEENGPTVYAIGLLGEEKARRARRALETIAQRTGGISFFPRTLDEVDAISSSVAHDIRNQYTIGYKPTTPKSAGGYRAIRVEAKAKGLWQARGPHSQRILSRAGARATVGDWDWFQSSEGSTRETTSRHFCRDGACSVSDYRRNARLSPLVRLTLSFHFRTL